MEGHDPAPDPQLLLERAQQGDSAAFGILYEQYYTPVFRYVFFRVKDKDEAEDLAQTVFLKVFRSVHRYQNVGKNPLAYFYTVARNTLIDYWRKERPVVLDDPDDLIVKMDARAAEHPVRQFADTGDLRAIREALHRLTQDQQDVITLRFLDDLSTKEIAELLGKTEEAVRQLQSRALRSLRRFLTPQSHHDDATTATR